MRTTWIAPALVAVIALSKSMSGTAAPPELVASSEARTPEEERAAFRLPEGFVAELVAAEPDIQKPMNIAFDDLGRLWVTDTVEYPYPAAPGTVPRDTVKVLSDFGPDGRARSIRTFADGLNIPIGVLPMPGGRKALVHNIPTVSIMEDTDGDGKADNREPVYSTYGSRDTHGMTNAFTWGFDGWVYATHGFSNDSKVAGTDGQAIAMQSGNTYRMRADGSRAEYYTHGQVNPFGLSFDPLGNIYSSDCHTKPIYQLLRGAWYPSFGKPHDGLGFGPVMCEHDHGSTGIAGIVYYAADQFPESHRGSVYVGNVVTSRVNRDNIEWTGSTPKAVEQPDLVASDDPWFRPVDLEIGPDGALYVADFYNRIIGHYEVPLTHPGRDRERGRIWRIVYKGKDAAPPKSPREDWSKATIEDLLADLGHPNIAVRVLASNALVARGTPEEATTGRLRAFVKADNEVNRRVHALWVLERLGALDEESLDAALSDADRTLRTHAHRLLGERPSLQGKHADRATAGLADADPFVRRASAESLARHPSTGHVRPLLTLRQSTPEGDTHLVHVARMALRDQFTSENAWDQLKVEALTERDAADIADIATGVPSAGSARYLLGYLGRQREEPQDNLVRYVQHVARYLDLPRRGALLEVVKARSGDRRLALLKAVQLGSQERGAPVDQETRAFAVGEILALLKAGNDPDRASGIELASAFRAPEALVGLVELSKNAEVPTPQRVEALAAVGVIDPNSAPGVIGPLLADPGSPPQLRERAAGLLGQSGRRESLKWLIDALPVAPERVQSAIAAALAGRREWAEALLTAVAAGKASARLLQEPRVAGPLGNAGVPDLSSRLEALLRGLAPADARTNDLINRRRAGYASLKSSEGHEAGRALFEKHCAACHQVGGVGGKVGPQLDGIAGRGPDRLMEDILDPGRNVDQAFRLTNLALKDGRVVSGLVLREEGAVLVLADAEGKEVRVPSEQVEERTVVPLSPMPANFAEQVPDEDFFRLIGYLMSRSPVQP